MQRVPGVGQAQLFGTERAMRIWIDPAKLVASKLSAPTSTAAIRAQNAQVSPGTIGDLPNTADQGIFAATVVVKGQLEQPSSSATSCCAPTPTAPPCACATWRASSSARRATAPRARLNGEPSTGIGIQLAPTGNALQTAGADQEAPG